MNSIRLFVGWECDLSFLVGGIFRPPQGGHGLPLRVELHTGLAVEVLVATERSTGPGEGEHGEWYGDGNIDTDLSHVHFLGEFSCRGSGVGEDGGAVAVSVTVDQLRSFVHRVGVQNNENGSEDLFTVALHSFGDVRKDCWADEITVFVPRHGDATTINNTVGSLVDSALNESFNSFLE